MELSRGGEVGILPREWLENGQNESCRFVAARRAGESRGVVRGLERSRCGLEATMPPCPPALLDADLSEFLRPGHLPQALPSAAEAANRQRAAMPLWGVLRAGRSQRGFRSGGAVVGDCRGPCYDAEKRASTGFPLRVYWSTG